MSPEQIEAVRADVQKLRNGLLYPWQHDEVQDRIHAALDHLTKANEELRAEVEEQARLNGMGAEHELSLRATIDRLTKERDELRTAFVRLLDAADRFNGVFNCTSRPAAEYQGQMILAVRNAYEVLGIGRTEKQPAAPDHKEIADLRTRLSAMQEAIDKAVRRADAMDAPVVQWPVKHITEPLRPFATKPEQFDPVEHGTRSDGEACSSAWVKGAPCDCNLTEPEPEPEVEVDPLVEKIVQGVMTDHGYTSTLSLEAAMVRDGVRTALAARNHTEGRTDG